MAYFTAIWTYGDDVERRQDVRPKHREYLQGLVDAGKVLMSGPFADDSGAVVIYDVADLSEAQELMSNDPFAQNGIIVDATVKEYKVVMARDKNLLS
ncbi:MAG TPA: YciI family protein [Thermomicrobiales bacterium]|nr:YciI family protein [Thermomicrobiales bacterium]